MAETLGGSFWIPVFAFLCQQSFCVNLTLKGASSSRASGRRDQKARAIESLGAQVWRVKLRRGRIPWAAILRRLAAKGALSVMIEGGATTAAWALQEKAVDRLLFFYAPMILGGDGRVMIDASWRQAG